MAADDDQTGLDLDGAAFRPPMLEDAGLEDCALPVESIMEAFARAAALAVAEDGKGGGEEEPDDDFDSEGSKKIALADEGSEEKGSSASETVVLGRNGSQEEISPPSPSKVAREEED